jgi:hypothetical protein
MKIFEKDLYSDREGKINTKVRDIFREPILNRIFAIMKKHSFIVTYSGTHSFIPRFMEKLYFHMDGSNSDEENLKHDSFQYYESFVKSTTLSKFFDSIELFCRELLPQRNLKIYEDNFRYFYINFNDLLVRNGLPYQLLEKDYEVVKIIALSESKFIQEKIKIFSQLISNKKFQDCEERFIEAQTCFARMEYDDVLMKCNTIIEKILCIILGKGSGTILDLYKEFMKKYKLPSVFKDSIKDLIETIQHARSRYPLDAHGKNEEKNNEDVTRLKKEIAELVLSLTASFGIFIIEIYTELEIQS